MKISHLKKANDDVISFCSCGDGRVTFPAQMDCPWCGCGWLFTCINCRKAFTFAEGVETEANWEDLAREDIRRRGNEDPSNNDVASWVQGMKENTKDVRAGVRYVVIDGSVVPADATNIEINGWHTRHNFTKVPQEEARSDKSILDVQLGNREYWTKHALPAH